MATYTPLRKTLEEIAEHLWNRSDVIAEDQHGTRLAYLSTNEIINKFGYSKARTNQIISEIRKQDFVEEVKADGVKWRGVIRIQHPSRWKTS